MIIPLHFRGKVYKLTVKATDLGLPPRSSTSSLSIRVNEVNDHPPQFEKTIYKTSLPENSLPGNICTLWNLLFGIISESNIDQAIEYFSRFQSARNQSNGHGQQ